MASIDLNIIDRGIRGTEWTAQNTGLQASQLDKVKESKTDNSCALNSLPTPFARFFVVREAFRRVAEEKRHPENLAGLAYERLVSDCLDVFELLFNKKFHANQWNEEIKINIKEWERKEEMKELHDNVPILYNALNATYEEDICEEKLFFVVLEKDGKDYLLGTSSPMTGFVTPPDLDKVDIIENSTPAVKMCGELYDTLKIHRKNRGEYFRDIVLFNERDKDFKNYMFQLFSMGSLDERFKEIRNYIHLFEADLDIQNNYVIKTGEILTEYNSELIVNGLKIGYNDETDINAFFMPKLIRLPYKINRNNFIGIQYERDDSNRDYDYLLPLRKEALRYLDKNLATCVCQLKKYQVVVKFQYNGTEYVKEYDLSNDVRDFAAENQTINIGLFPNILSSIESENNYFKIALIVSDKNDGDGKWHTLSIDDAKLSFYKKDGKDEYCLIEEADEERGAKNGAKSAVVRSRQHNGDAVATFGTKYYELFNTDFDAVELAIGDDCGFLLPKWRRAVRTNDNYKYAIDLGTSNTFVSRTKTGDNAAPEMFSMKEPMVSYLHDYTVNRQYSEVSSIEDAMDMPICEAMKTEFVPPFIDGIEYRFPIRTVMCKARNIADQPKLFNNHNIAFFYEKMMETDFQECKTDIKWEENEDCINVYIRELLLIIKCDVLQRNGMLNQTSIVWFRPLSFSGSTKRIYERTWKKLAKEILFTDDIECYTESEAPYYYFAKRNIIKNTDAVTVIDIGGGSTDYVYFSQNSPVSASSVHFGCNVLWGNGHNEFDNMRENGIYNKYVDSLNWREHDDLRRLESEMKMNRQCSTTDMINFWLGNCKYNDIIDRLHDDYLPLFVYHFTAIIYYVAALYKYKNYTAPKTIVFSGNGSRYIDNFITSDKTLIEKAVTAIFSEVYGELENIHVVMPDTRKESTCYGGLYRPANAEDVPAVVYHGVDRDYDNVGQMNEDFCFQSKLLLKYEEMNNLFCKVLDIMKKGNAVDNSVDLNLFKQNSKVGYKENLSTHYLTDIKQKYTNDEDECNDSAFFIPVVDKIFEMTKLV